MFRRATDKISPDRALELVCALAYEKALERDDEGVLAEVENAILKLREMKLEQTGSYPILTGGET